MALVFVLPTFRACSEDPLHSPAHFATSDLLSAAWIAPPFLIAGLLALLTARALRRKEVDRTTRRIGLVAVAGLGLSALVTGGLYLWPLDGMKGFALGGLVAALGIAGAMVRNARGRQPWMIWDHLLGAFAIIAAVSGPGAFLAGELLFGSRSLLGPGAYLYLGSIVMLIGVSMRAVLRAGHR